MNKQLYIKKNGKYVKASDPDILEGGLTEGAYLVIVKQGGKSIKTMLNPKLADLTAALEYLHEGICKELAKAEQLRLRSVQISEKEQKAWKEFRKTMGKDMPTRFEYASNSEIADKACTYVREIMTKYNFDLEKIKEVHTIEKPSSKNVIFDMDLE